MFLLIYEINKYRNQVFVETEQTIAEKCLYLHVYISLVANYIQITG